MNKNKGSILSLLLIIIALSVVGVGGYYFYSKDARIGNDPQTGVLKDLKDYEDGGKPGKNNLAGMSEDACDYFTLSAAKRLLNEPVTMDEEGHSANFCKYVSPNPDSDVFFLIHFSNYDVSYADESIKEGKAAGITKEIEGLADRAWYIGIDKKYSIYFIKNGIYASLSHNTYMEKFDPNDKISDELFNKMKNEVKEIMKRYPR
jgi:hypothetical protein